jgi:MFS transporter, DHA3 family, macrolide efflux protein
MTASVPWRRTFVIFYAGQFIALTGLGLAMFSIGDYVYGLFGSAVIFGIAMAIQIVPFIVASPVAGPLVDRWGPRRALLVANALGLANLLVLAVLQASGAFANDRTMLWPARAVSPTIILVFLWAAAAIKALHLAAFDASYPFLVPKQHLGRANGLRMIVTAVSAVLGPVLALPLMMGVGFYGVVVLGCLSFVVGIGSLRYVPVPAVRRDGVTAAARAGILREFREVWRYAVARHGLVALMVLYGVINFGIGSAELLATQLTLSFASPAALNTVLVAGALGLVAGTLLATAWGRPRRRSVGVFGFSLLFGAALVLGSLRPSVALLAVAAFLFLGSTPITIGAIQTLWQMKTEPQLLGRMAALVNLFTDVPYSLGNIWSGVTAGLVFVPLVGSKHVRSAAVAALVGHGAGRGFALNMLVLGVLIAACVAVSYRYPRLRHLERNLPDVTPEDVAARTERAVVEPTAR